MIIKEYRIALDVKSNKIINTVSGIVQNDSDSNVFIIDLVMDNKPLDITGYSTITASVLREDGTSVINSIGEYVEVLDETIGRIKVTLSSAMVTSAGTHQMSIEVYDNTKKLSSSRFAYQVVGDLVDGVDPSTDTEFPVLQQLVTQVSERLAEMDELVTRVEEVETKEEERVLAEEERIANEELRVTNEDARNVFEAYDDAKEYVVGNKVAYEGSSYVCKINSKGVLPTNDSNWLCIAEKGSKGDTGDQGEQGEQGEPGVSPTITTSKENKTTTITITDINGTSTATILDGIDGIDGIDGTNGIDGISPTITSSKVGKVTTINITDKNGTQTLTINDGADGEGSGDMVTSVYDPQNKAQDIFSYVDKKEDIIWVNNIDNLEDVDVTITTNLTNVYTDGSWELDATHNNMYKSYENSDGSYGNDYIFFTTTEDNQYIIINYEVSSKKSNGIMTIYDTNGNPYKIASGELVGEIAIPIPTAGDNYLEIRYKNEYGERGGSDCVWYSIKGLSDTSVAGTFNTKIVEFKQEFSNLMKQEFFDKLDMTSDKFTPDKKFPRLTYIEKDDYLEYSPYEFELTNISYNSTKNCVELYFANLQSYLYWLEVTFDLNGKLLHPNFIKTRDYCKMPSATISQRGGVKLDNETIKSNSSGRIYVVDRVLYDITLTEAVNKIYLTGIAGKIKEGKIYAIMINGKVNNPSYIYLGTAKCGYVDTENDNPLTLVKYNATEDEIYTTYYSNTIGYYFEKGTITNNEFIKLEETSSTFNVGTRIIIKEVI